MTANHSFPFRPLDRDVACLSLNQDEDVSKYMPFGSPLSRFCDNVMGPRSTSRQAAGVLFTCPDRWRHHSQMPAIIHAASRMCYNFRLAALRCGIERDTILP
jgi:hypothetical protein